ncbi:hypothetical protein J6590_074749 [Homalodisca vitripennis]|nr:hypothetical protein J6590_074749 [Homalodisca vitripennis]
MFYVTSLCGENISSIKYHKKMSILHKGDGFNIKIESSHSQVSLSYYQQSYKSQYKNTHLYYGIVLVTDQNIIIRESYMQISLDKTVTNLLTINVKHRKTEYPPTRKQDIKANESSYLQK